jgi:hypothetical protein
MKTISGEWSIHSTGDVVVERLSETAAWDYLLNQTVDPNAKMFYRDKVMARYHESSPIRPRPPAVPIESARSAESSTSGCCAPREEGV